MCRRIGLGPRYSAATYRHRASSAFANSVLLGDYPGRNVHVVMVPPDEPALGLVETQGIGGAVEGADRRVEEIVTAHVIARADIAGRRLQEISADVQSGSWTPSAFEDLAAPELRGVARTI